jgi:2-polyprenyl-3-methyl-5-hydroxy-6-metoxy-1,4-benzoquinol methylase
VATDPLLLHHADYVVPHLLDLFPLASGETVLDVGCGNGSIDGILASRGYRVVAFDQSEESIAVARQSYPACEFHVADVDSPPAEITGASFDNVLSVESIEHMIDPRAMLRLARRVLRPGGRLIITTPYHGYLKNVALAVSGKLDGHFTVLWDGGHVKFFSVNTLTTMLEEEGFRVRFFRFAGRLPLLWKSMICCATPQ